MGYEKYRSHDHKHNGICGNKLMTGQDRLEEQLLTVLEQRLLPPRYSTRLVARCEDELAKRLVAMERAGTMITTEALKRELEDRHRCHRGSQREGGDIGVWPRGYRN